MLIYKNDHEILGLQILKLICAFFVVEIHFNSSANILLSPITRIAVPIFFMITGYFLIDKDGLIQSNKIRAAILKNIKLYVFVTIIYLLYDLIWIRNFSFFQRFTHTSFWIDYIFIGDKSRHMWYIIALIESLIIIYIGYKLKLKKFVWLVIPLCLLLNFALGKYNFLFEKYGIPNDLILSRNAITTGIPFILTGILIRRYEYKLPSLQLILLFLVIVIAGLYTEHFYLSSATISIGDMICFTVPAAIFVFIAFLRFNPNSAFYYKLAEYGKFYSMDIYFWHPLLASILSILLCKVFQELKFYNHFRSFIIFVVTLGIAILLRHFKLNKFYK